MVRLQVAVDERERFSVDVELIKACTVLRPVERYGFYIFEGVFGETSDSRVPGGRFENMMIGVVRKYFFYHFLR